ncbi:FecR family protein [Parapedobacter deserti]|uniref:FecR family protein n=2 Tax=Parapedobacter deserti TaxID=1912957 RepID=A0ABV7JPM9_9SPHI
MAGILTPQEQDELLAQLVDTRNKHEAEKLLAEAWGRFTPGRPVFSREEGQKMMQRILEKHQAVDDEPVEKVIAFSVWRRLLLAASIVLIATLAVYMVVYKADDKSNAQTLSLAVERAGIEPGKERAVITLGDGRTIILDDIGHGLLAEEPGVHIRKIVGGQVQYELSPQAETAPIADNTITVPRGGQYRLVLPDGTKVHLNAESMLVYPTRFDNTAREVRLTGEAYFEVTQQYNGERGRQVPFVVHTAAQKVDVLGTSFNIQAYSGATRTALVEGSVRVTSAGGDTVVLQPGEAAVQPDGQPMIKVEKINMDEELAWHNGYFIFNDEGIQGIMQRIARWYDVEVSYQGNMSDKRFGGIFQRSKSVAQLLENFRTTGLVDFKIEERRIIVMEK